MQSFIKQWVWRAAAFVVVVILVAFAVSRLAGCETPWTATGTSGGTTVTAGGDGETTTVEVETDDGETVSVSFDEEDSSDDADDDGGR